jgi:hypothetical protein
MAFTSDTTRTWGRDFETLWGEPVNRSAVLTEENCDSRYYRQFWVNATRWLAAGRIGRTNNPVTLELAQSYSRPNESVTAAVKVRDTELKVISGADVRLLLASAGQTNAGTKATFDRASQSYLVELRPSQVGDCTVTAMASFKGQNLGEDRQLLVCESGDREMADLRAKPDLMATLSRTSGGRVFAAMDREGGVVASAFAKSPPVTVEHRRTPLWDRAWWLGTILFLLAVEWVVRRLNGLA